ncbi:zinc metalloprotease HtpX [Thiobacter aerophilum]|uniref:Protease HtpX homolog n=1 Tax=Thiobacter aerophilum TaxID=3121275 RepID=A0ABV0ECX9_9BURK
MFGNWIKTALLMATIVALFGMIGMALGGATGMLLGLAFAAVTNFWAYWNSDQLVLRMYQAEEVDAASAPALYGIVAELARRAGLPMPRVYVIDEDQPNAFATGRDPEHAAVAATTGILHLLSPRELRGVLAHELAHIKHRDTLISTLSASIAGAISTLAQFGMLFGGRGDEREGVHPLVALLVMIVAPIAALIIQMAISRTREFEADRGGAEISGDPEALAAALEKIHAYANQLPMATAQAHPETAQMMIINPLTGGGLMSLFSTHPPVEARVARLLAMARGAA